VVVLAGDGLDAELPGGAHVAGAVPVERVGAEGGGVAGGALAHGGGRHGAQLAGRARVQAALADEAGAEVEVPPRHRVRLHGGGRRLRDLGMRARSLLLLHLLRVRLRFLSL
jgi:hypothetical protein